jgi:ABC-type lipoprotein export system ATPase subunit
VVGRRYYVLWRINLDIQEGEFMTIMGSAAAGKSTLRSILGMLDRGLEGEFFFLEQAVHKLAQKNCIELNKRNIGFVFQQYHLLDSLTVAENLGIPLSYRNVKSPERQALVADTLDRFQIVGEKDLLPN